MVVVLQVLDETISYADSLIHSRTLETLFTETCDISEIFVKVTDRPLFEHLDIVDSVPSVAYAKVLSELQIFSDAFFRHVSRRLYENVALHDAVVYGKFLKELLESYVVGDTFKYIAGKLLRESNVASDLLRQTVVKLADEIVQMRITFTKTVYDNFEDADISDWVFREGTWTASSDASYSGNYGLRCEYYNESNIADGYKNSEPLNANHILLEGYVSLDSSSEASWSSLNVYTDWNDGVPVGGYGFLIYIDSEGSGGAGIVGISNGDYSWIGGVDYPIEFNTWYKIRLVVKPDGTIEGYIDDSLVISVADTTYNVFNYIGTSAFGMVYFDEIKANCITSSRDGLPAKTILKKIIETSYLIDRYMRFMTLVDTIQHMDSLTRYAIKQIVNPLYVRDTQHKNILRLVLNQMAITDIVSKLPHKVLFDMLQASDTRHLIRLLVEMVHTSDSAVKWIYYLLRESVSHSDLQIKHTLKQLVELQNYADILVRSTQKLYVELMSIIDVCSNIIHKLRIETVALADSFIRTVNNTIQEYIIYTDSMIKSCYSSLKEAVVYLDATFNYHYLQLKDYVSHLDSIFKSTKSTLSDHVFMRDVPMRNPVMVLKEMVSYVDRNVVGWILAEMASIKDTFSKTTLFKYLKNKATSLVSKLTKSYPR